MFLFKHQSTYRVEGLYHVCIDQVTVIDYGNGPTLHSENSSFCLCSPPSPLHNAEPAALMLDPFFFVLLFVNLFVGCFFLSSRHPTMMLVILLKRKWRQSERDTTNTDEAEEKKKKKTGKTA